MTTTEDAGPGRFEALRARHPWLDHVVRAGSRYAEKHGDHYAAAITYFSVLALVPVLMMAFAAAGYVLAGDPHLLAELQSAITSTVPATLAPTVTSIITTAIDQRDAVGILGLAFGLVVGLGWTANLREALSEQWAQRRPAVPLVRRYGTDLLAMIGLALALLLSFGVTAAGTGMSGTVIELLGLDRAWLTRLLVVLAGLALTLLADWIVLVWVIARLPREPVTRRSAVRAAALGAVGLVALQQLVTVYLARVTTSPAGVAFGPILGLLVFTNLVARLVLFVTAWAATLGENAPEAADEPASVVVRPAITVRRPPSTVMAALLGAAAAVGAVVGACAHRR
ncbi:YhjD/YihY/BrkB family envelope integrity protein [Actinomycetospora straminea]|uniref:Inner membrane protein YhjD n=1 Tax=Actinomycetospora straminea TaxID=663607 RepID=A0ABP9EIA2_9PSEU|nr:YhjD/YihY/BrkB family envelope integrity protein [Actinomycetospora straminea]MDD7933404.1 YhjD/YihY/BrkB family envelope integrity protein [Actinomycetospora straminea]